jgi:hypothetical protein
VAEEAFSAARGAADDAEQMRPDLVAVRRRFVAGDTAVEDPLAECRISVGESDPAGGEEKNAGGNGSKNG